MNRLIALANAAIDNSQLEVTEFVVKKLLPVEAERELTETCRLCEVVFPLTKEQAERVKQRSFVVFLSTVPLLERYPPFA